MLLSLFSSSGRFLVVSVCSSGGKVKKTYIYREARNLSLRESG